jgi:hypothetical protein
VIGEQVRPVSEMRCAVCGQSRPLLAGALDAHTRSRQLFDLPETPPRSVDGAQYPLCGCECVIGEGERGYCGLRTVRMAGCDKWLARANAGCCTVPTVPSGRCMAESHPRALGSCQALMLRHTLRLRLDGRNPSGGVC